MRGRRAPNPTHEFATSSSTRGRYSTHGLHSRMRCTSVLIRRRLADPLTWAAHSHGCARTGMRPCSTRCSLPHSLSTTLKEKRMSVLFFHGQRGPVRVELADRLRRRHTATWPAVIRAVVAGWTPETLGRLAYELAQAANDAIENLLGLSQRLDLDADETPSPPASAAPEELAPPPESGVETDAARELRATLQRQKNQYQTLEQKYATLLRESLAIRHRDSKRLSRIEALSQDLQAAEKRQRELQTENFRLKNDLRALAPAPVVDEPTSPKEEGPSAELTNRLVLLFTAEGAGNAREALASSFRAHGATDVQCYWTDKERVPDTVPADAVVVIDKRFMSHSASEVVLRAARKSGAWYCVTDHAASRIAQVVVEKLLTRSAT
jgi:hypothetical protein